MHPRPSAKLSRRHLVNKAAAATTLSALASQTAIARARGKRRSPIVLVHPAWHGGWRWKKITSLLRLRGYDVYAPTLTGLGERSHLLRREIGLDTHVEDVVGILKYEDLTDAVLVGHSSSGMVVTSVADRVPGQVRHIVYLDAFIPEDGQSLVDLLPPNRRQAMEALVAKEGDGWQLPRLGPWPWEQIIREQWGVHDEVDVRWMLARLAATPFRHFTDPRIAPALQPSGSRAPTSAACDIHSQSLIGTPQRRAQRQDGSTARSTVPIIRQLPIRLNLSICLRKRRTRRS